MNKQIVVYLLTILAALTGTLLLIAVVMNPPMGDLVELGRLLGVTAVISAGVGYLTYRFGLWRQFRSLSRALAVSYLIAAGLTLLNVWLTARLMFINEHDLALATLLLLFGAVISVSFGIFISGSSMQALNMLARGARRVSDGDLTTRVPEDGRDEIAQLSADFNEMVRRLEAAAAGERALEQARRDLVAWASHDLRTPLASLRAMIDALVDGVADDAETARRYLRQSQQEIARMSRLIDDLFELAQLDTGGLALSCEAASISDLISDALEGFTEPARSAGVHLKGTAAPGVDPVFMAPDKIARVLTNLIENALGYTPAGGSVTVAAGLREAQVVVSVADSGAGIALEDRPRVFERFFRGEKSRTRERDDRGGGGLGLAISKGIVEAHGGSIWLNEMHSPGTMISFSLPKNGKMEN
ncbi:MAG TPA: ATP-binding protein [Anaerolineales bacterium]|nr:ATP-binding protein [Anaerolineales bacterium]